MTHNVFIKRILFPVVAGCLLCVGCGSNSSRQANSNNPGETIRAKTTASKEDPCRIVMVQKRPVKESGSETANATHSYLTTVLSDGTDERVVVDVDSIGERIKEFKEFKNGINPKEESLSVKKWNDFLISKIRNIDSVTIVSLSPNEKGALLDEVYKRNFALKNKERVKDDSAIFNAIKYGFDEKQSSDFSRHLFEMPHREPVMLSISDMPEVSKDLKYLLFHVSYHRGHYRGIHGRISENAAMVNLETGRFEFAINDSEEDYRINNGRKEFEPEQEIKQWEFCQNSAEVLVIRENSILVVNAQSGKRTRFQQKKDFYLFNFFPISISEFIVNFRCSADKQHSANHCGKFAISTGTTIRFPAAYDSLTFESFAVSENGQTLLFFSPQSRKNQEDIANDSTNDTVAAGTEEKLSTDTVWVFNAKLEKQKRFMIGLKPGKEFYAIPDPIGKWLYYSDGSSIYRIQVSFFQNEKAVLYEDVLKNSQIVYNAATKKGILFEVKSFFLTRSPG